MHPKGLEERVILGPPRETATSYRISLTVPVGKNGSELQREDEHSSLVWQTEEHSTVWRTGALPSTTVDAGSSN